MAGLPVETDPNTGQTNVLDTQYVMRSQGTTAQNMAGPAMSEGATSVGNSSAVVAPGTANPQDVSGRPGYLAGSEPGGNPSDVLVPGGQYNTDNNVQDVSAPAGTAGGGTYYPNQSGADAVPNPMIAKGWTIQNSSGGVNEDDPNISVVVNPEYTAAHDATVTNLFTPTIAGGTSPYTVTVVEVDGATTSTLPTGFTLTSASTGEISLTTASTAGTYTLGFRVTDSASPANHADYEVTVVLS
jgi:hypothetical protein